MVIDRNKLPEDPVLLKNIILDLSVQNQDKDDIIDKEKERYVQLDEKYAHLDERYTYLEEKYKTLQRMLHGKKSEKLTPEDEHQMRLFNEAEDGSEENPDSIVDERAHEPAMTRVAAYTRKKRGRKPLPAHIPREEIVHDLTEEEKSCPCCGKERPLIGEEVTEELDIIPAKIVVNRHIRKKYGPCRCDAFLDARIPEVKTATLPPRLVPYSIVSPGLAAYSIIAKFCDALPFYRQSKIFERLDIALSRATLCNWAMLVAEKCQPLIDLMIKEIRGGPLIRMDETTLQVLNEPGRTPESTSYIWVAMGYTAQENPLVVYRYHPTRSSEVPQQFLEGYTGYLQTDGYGGYNRAVHDSAISHVGCFAHARRYFENAYKLNKKSRVGFKGLDYIQKIYAIEKKLRGSTLSPEMFIESRKKEVFPILDSLYNWLQSQVDSVVPKSKAGEAIKYTLAEWDKLVRYLEHHLLTPDNNLVENAIRPFVMGRKNWLFANTPRGAQSSAVLYSLIESAKTNGLEPYGYLRYLFDRLPGAVSKDQLRSLLPDRITPEMIKLP